MPTGDTIEGFQAHRETGTIVRCGVISMEDGITHNSEQMRTPPDTCLLNFLHNLVYNVLKKKDDQRPMVLRSHQ